MYEKKRTQRVFSLAMDTPSYLDINNLEDLLTQYPYPPKYGYDMKSVEARGKERASRILRLPGAGKAQSFLELACWDGMVSGFISQKGKISTAIDNRDTGFDKRAANMGVSLLQMDAAKLLFDDSSFDFVFSFDAFEHFASPESVIREAIRVVRKGGSIYLEFGPLYYSPYGEHAYNSIPVPYCQFLFQKDQINNFTIQKGLEAIDFNEKNGWSLEDYRNLWEKYSSVIKCVRYHETLDLSHLYLINKYSSCFKSKTNYFDNLITSRISVLFQKTDEILPAM
ncbi:MAG: class I SAM-dependent methyltransferase [Leptolinea sp.]|jgi:SAM-dependent methyltransferase|nr:class I SAM-dependent methyltransferase [Leptolinea sp.]